MLLLTLGDKTKDVFSGEETTPLPEQTTVPDQTTLIPNEAEAFALEPIDVTSIGNVFCDLKVMFCQKCK